MAGKSRKLYFAPGDSTLGVFAGERFRRGDFIVRFTGAIYGVKDLPPIVRPQDDRFVQVGIRKYMGPSGGVDDYFNHSCNPNAGLTFVTDSKINLIAIKDISPGEEITWDYSTTMDEDDWEMNCKCGAANCRRRIRDFKYLPRAIQKKYAMLGIVPAYNLAHMTA